MKETLIGPKGAGQRRYSTGLWDIGPGVPPGAPYRGRGWTIGLRRFEHDGRDFRKQQDILARKLGHFPPADASVYTDGAASNGWVSAPELVIFAKSRETAQRAANLLFAAMLLYEGSSPFLEGIIAVPEDSSERDRYPSLYFARDVDFVSTGGLAASAKLAAKLSSKRSLQYAVLKFWASHRICSIPLMDTHPRKGQAFGVERDRANHVLFAQAIVLAYSVIEELGFEVRVNRGESSTLPGGGWNPRVKSDLEARLVAGKIDLTDEEAWIARGPKTRVERKRALPAGPRTNWSGGPIRDRHIAVIDAIARASWLRSKIGAHRFSDLAPSLTAFDVANVQMLARRLLLEHVGFLPTTKAHARNVGRIA